MYGTRYFLQIVFFIIFLSITTKVFPLDPNKAISQYIQDTWQTEQGLPVNTTQTILQTSSGYLWFGTEEGLARFDGVRFRVFDKTNTKEMTNHNIWALYEDSKKNLWIGTYGGGVLRYKDGSFSAFTTKNGLSANEIWSIFEDRKGNLWIATDGGGLNCLQNEKFKIYTTKEGLSHNSVFSLYEDRYGTLWAGTRAGLDQFRDGKFQPFKTREGSFQHSVRSIQEDKEGGIWIGTSEGLGLVKKDTITTFTTKDGLPNNRIWCVRVDKHGNVWAGTDGGGLARYNKGKFSIDSPKEGSSNDIVFWIYEDREGSLWVGTSGRGVKRLGDSKFTSFTTQEGLSDNFVRPILEDADGTLWIGTDGGLNKFRDGRFSSLTTRDGLSSNRILSILQDRNRDLWIGTHDGGLNRIRNGKVEIFTTKDGLAADMILSIYQDHAGNIWIGTARGLNKFVDGKFSTFTTKDGLPSDRIRVFHETHEGLWIGTRNGLSLYHNGTFKSYTVAQGLSSEFINALHVDESGNLWIGTTGGGLNLYRNGKFTPYTTRDGLFDDVVSHILDDGNGRYWMGCGKGIFSVSKKELLDFAAGTIRSISSKSYGIADGMRSNECNGGSQPAGWKTRDGILWFPTIRGIVRVDPVRLQINSIPPLVHIEQLISDDKVLDPLATLSSHGGIVELPPGKGSLEFQYTGLSFLAPSRVKFKYKLDGFDEKWIEAGTRRSAYYTNIPPGDYNFRVIASNNDGVWNETGASLGFYLQPHFYQTGWFYALCALFCVVIGWAVHRYRVARIIEIERVRTRIATDLHDDIGSGLSQIAILSEVSRGKMNHTDNHLEDDLKSIAAASRELVDSMSDIVWAVNPGKDHFKDLVQRMRRFASDLLTSRNISFHFEQAVLDPERKLSPDLRRHVYLIFKEALNNMIRHSKCTAADISLQIEGGWLLLQIIDNGRGFDPPETTHGQGLRNMRQRALEMKGHLGVKSIPEQGTTVTLRVPLARSFFSFRKSTT